MKPKHQLDAEFIAKIATLTIGTGKSEPKCPDCGKPIQIVEVTLGRRERKERDERSFAE
jgi:hypothetical protein